MSLHQNNRFSKTYYTLAGNMFQGFFEIINGNIVVYDLNMQVVPGATVVQDPSELDFIQSELIPIVINNQQFYLRINTVFNNLTGLPQSTINEFFDNTLNPIATPSTYKIGLLNETEYHKTYYQLGGSTLEGYISYDGTSYRVYDLQFIEQLGAIPVGRPIQSVNVLNQLTVGDQNEHKEILAGGSFSFSNIKGISLLIKGNCTVNVNGVTISYEDGDSFSFSSELELLNPVIVNQITGRTIVLTLK